MILIAKKPAVIGEQQIFIPFPANGIANAPIQNLQKIQMQPVHTIKEYLPNSQPFLPSDVMKSYLWQFAIGKIWSMLYKHNNQHIKSAKQVPVSQINSVSSVGQAPTNKIVAQKQKPTARITTNVSTVQSNGRPVQNLPVKISAGQIDQSQQQRSTANTTIKNSPSNTKGTIELNHKPKIVFCK